MAKEALQRPRQTVRLVPEPGERCIWCQATIDSKPAMHVVCRCYATNIIDNPIYLLKAYISKPLIEGDIVVKHYKSAIYSTYPIFPNSTTQVAIHFFIQPPRCKAGEDFKSAVTIIDMYGNEHKTGKIKFTGLKAERKNDELNEGESISAIQDPIEKKVAEVLKSEICKYETCGKKEGGLGSLITKYKNRVIIGVGSDLRTLCFPEDQPIVEDPQNAKVESDNADLLLSYYENLQKQEDKEAFNNALLKRLNRNCEYKTVGYFIVLLLSRLGQLGIALEMAKSNLRGDSEYGFSNVLMLLDGMLKYIHNVFTEGQLDEIERFVKDIKEHIFRIHERIAAIHNLRRLSNW